MKTFYNILIFVFVIVLSKETFGQDVNFSQFYELPMLRNPSLGGVFKGDLRVSSAYRNQWQSVTVPYQTSALGIDFKSSVSQNSSDFFSAGLQITRDVAGDSKLGKTQFFPMVTYHKLIYGPSNTYLSLGFLGGPVQQRFDPSTLRFDDQFVNGAYSITNPTRQTFFRTSVDYFDAAFGLTLSTELNYTKAYIGASYFHFTQPKVAFNPISDVKLNQKLVVNMGLNAPVSDFDDLILYGDLFFQGGSRQFQGGVMYMYRFMEASDEDEGMGLGFGGFYRWDDAFIPVLKYNYYKLSLGLTYDINVSKLRVASLYRGGAELTLTYKTYLNIMNTSLQKFRCIIPF